MPLDPSRWIAAGAALPTLAALTLLFSFLSALLPFISMEVVVALVALAAPTALVPALVVAGTAAHMMGKGGIYLAAREVERLPQGRLRTRLLAARRGMDRYADMGSALLFVSASLGLPPFYLTTVASGMLRFPLARFLAVGFVGRLLRFGLVAAFPATLAWLWQR